MTPLQQSRAARAYDEARSHHASRRFHEAEAAYVAALATAPGWSAALYGLGAVALQTGRSDEAVGHFGRALLNADEGQRAGLYEGLAVAHRRRGDLASALIHYREAARLQPSSVTAAMNLGAALGDTCAYAEAVQAFKNAILLDPRLVDARRALATTLNRLSRHAEAAQVAREGLVFAPEDAVLATSLANALKEEGRLAEAAAVLRRSLQVRPGDLDVRYNLGAVLKDQGRTEEAVACYRELLRRAPSHAAAHLAMCMAHLPALCRDEDERRTSRSAYDAALRTLNEWSHAAAPDALAAGVGASQPFYLAYQGEDDVELQRLYGSLICRAMEERYPPAPLAHYDGSERIRVAFVSGYFRDHANWRLPIRGWVETMDRARFHLVGYHTSAAVDEMTEVAARSFETFVQGPMPLERWRERIAADLPHVLIYPEVGMDPVALQLASQRLAPVQCVSWGHPVTSGLPSLDCFLSSADMEPTNAEASYTERLVRLPGLSTPCWLPDPAAAVVPRSVIGVREDAFVFWCAQSPQKFLPQSDYVFPAIAERVPLAQFVFSAFSGSDELTERFRSRLRVAFEKRGLSFQRFCVFIPRVPSETYRAMMAASDAFLDSIGWSGCNSLLEALACGLPVVSLEGKLMRARHGGAILRLAGLEQYVCNTEPEYVQRASQLAARPCRDLHVRRRKLLEGRLRDAASTRALERLLKALLIERSTRSS